MSGPAFVVNTAVAAGPTVGATPDPALILAVLCLAGAVALGLAWLTAFLSARPIVNHLVDGPRPRLPLFWRWGAPLIDPLAAHLAPWLSAATRFALVEQLRRAGLDVVLGPERFLAGRLLAAGLGGGFAAVLGHPFGGPSVLLVVASVGVAGFLPRTWLADLVRRRERAVLRELPFYLDVITLAVEAGLNLSAALAQAADKGPPGALRDEFERVLRDVRAGRPRADALRAMAERLAQPAVGSLVSCLIVAEQQGGALGPVLRAQAEQRRTERFQRAERLAMEAPVKMLAPLLLFIFPCTFAVLLFPVAARMLMEGWLK
jgi:tight adherence protein C